MSVINGKNISFDFEKSCYDLALLYAKARLDQAVQAGNFSEEPTEKLDKLMDDFYQALSYLSSQSKDKVRDLVNHC